ncbi:MAG: hypothetical protein QF531_05695, partial [Candidatus Poseidonia sp.]|nr:hypothetical protein [Poseidonia sp.]
MNPFVALLSLKALCGDIVRAIAALSRPSPRKGEVFPWTRTDGQAALTRKPALTGVRIGSDRTL